MNEIARRLAERLFDQPIIQNQYRSDFVEAMVDPYLVPAGWHHSGENWSGWDFEHSSGARLEVKQSAAHQTWSHLLQAKAPGSFDIAARTGYYAALDAKWVSQPGRNAHIYVFAWNGSYGADTDHRDERQWEFYVVPASVLPSGQKKITLTTLKAKVATAGLDAPVSISKLADAVGSCLSALQPTAASARK